MRLKKSIHDIVRNRGAVIFYVGRTSLRQINLARGDGDALHFRGYYYDIPGHPDWFGGFTSISAAVSDCYHRFCQGSRPRVSKSALRASAGVPVEPSVIRPAWDRRSLPRGRTAA